MSIRRRAAAIGAVSLGLVALAACEKPTPLATVTVGDKTVTTQANPTCYADGKDLTTKAFTACLSAVKPTKTITVHAGDQVRIGVDPKIADNGWLVAAGLSQKTDVLTNKTYWSLGEKDSLFTDSSTGTSTDTVTLNIIETAGKNAKTYLGVWKVKLVKKD
jgi:FtsP/CotA-like multicopper oxidase with cupredoxin domain